MIHSKILLAMGIGLILLQFGCVSSDGQVNPPASNPTPDTAQAFVKEPNSLVQTVAFGSCNKTTLPQPLWKHVIANQPDLWIWTGDIIYADEDPPETVVAKYQTQKTQKDYAQLRASTQVLGIWDDHEYGLNNGGKEYEDKANSQTRLLDFLDVPANHPRRSRKGAYDAVTYGPPDKRVKIILLDHRYHREEPGPTSDVLGETQWAWLEKELRDSDAQLHLIISGVQVVAPDHPFEKWSQFPKALQRLYQLIGDTSAPGVVFISGDRHLAEISEITNTPAGYPLMDITSSGLTHSYHEFTSEENRLRVAPVYAELNFGQIQIDWDEGTVDLQIRDQSNQVVRNRKVAISSLTK